MSQVFKTRKGSGDSGPNYNQKFDATWAQCFAREVLREKFFDVGLNSSLVRMLRAINYLIHIQ